MRSVLLRLGSTFVAGWTLVLPATTAAQSASDLDELERECAAARDAYLDVLGEHLPAAYRERLTDLSPREMEEIATTRRLWSWYIAEGPFTMGDPRKQATGIFRQEFLDPIVRVAGILLIDPAELRDSDRHRRQVW